MWSDERFRRLSPLPPSGQSLWFFLLTGPHTGPIPGLFRAGRAAMAEELDWPLEAFDEAFGEAFQEGMAKADFKARLVFLPNAIKHNRPESPNVVRGWRSELSLLPECDLKNEAIAHLMAELENMGEPYARALSEALGERERKPSAKPSANPSAKAMPNQEQEQEQDKYTSSLRSDVVAPDAPPAQPDHPPAGSVAKRSRSDASLATPADLMALLPGLSIQAARDYMAYRKRRRAALTPSALKPIAEQVRIACAAHGHTADEALAEAQNAGWAGFRADWYAKRVTDTPRGAADASSSRPDQQKYRLSAAERVAQNAARELAEIAERRAAAQGTGHPPLDGHEPALRPPMGEQLRRGDRPGERLERVLEGDYLGSD